MNETTAASTDAPAPAQTAYLWASDGSIRSVRRPAKESYIEPGGWAASKAGLSELKS
jgi:hypothetical protein